MFRNKSLISSVSIACMGIMAASCAGTATGAKSTGLAVMPPNVALQNPEVKGAALVTIRYPASVDPSALGAFREAYQTTPIGGTLKETVLGEDDANAIADGFALKSNYFAMSLYRELKSRLPENTILLSPHQIITDASGKLSSEPISEMDLEDFPSVLTVDFAAYSFPDLEKMMDSEPLTFGDLVSPILVIHSDHRGIPPTQGLIVASEPLLSSSAARSIAKRKESLTNLQSGTFSLPVPPLDIVSFLNGTGSASVPNTRLNGKGDLGNSVGNYQLEKVRMPELGMRQMATDPKRPIDVLETVFSDAAADRIIASLNKIDDHKATMVERAAAYSRFDPDLGALSFSGLDTVAYQERLALASKLLEAERKFLSVRSDNLFEDVYTGEFGAQTREMIKVEFDALSERRRLANQQNMATGLAILSAAVAVGTATQAEDFSANEQLAAQIALGVAAVAAMQAYNAKVNSDLIGQNFMVAMAPSLRNQVDVSLSLLDSDLVISARSLEEFREKTLSLYEDRMEPMDASSTECGYLHDTTAIVGKWLGQCANGLASGPGVGVVQFSDGSIVEYFGNAADGKPNGVGYMITHSATGSVGIEGAFSGGKPDGVVKLSSPGQYDTLRVYQGGLDTGAAPEGSSAPSLFQSAPASDLIAMLRVVEPVRQG